MNRFFYKTPSFVFVLVIAGALVYYSPALRMYITQFTDSINSFYHSIVNSIYETINIHTFQAKRIKELKDELNSCKDSFYTFRSDIEQYHSLKKELLLHNDVNISSQIIQPLGYAQLGNFQKLWLERFKDYDPRYIYGVLKDGSAVGIIVEKQNRPLMVLAGDPECNFAVYIGKSKAPGIAFGLDAKTMVVRYIPEWIRISIGDKVVTSGLDYIFPMGVLVGEVLKIKKMQGFQNAQIRLYGDTLHPNFLHLIYPRGFNKEKR